MASQIRGEYEEKKTICILVRSLIAQFTKFEVAQVPRAENRMVDALANLDSNASYPCHVELNVLAHSLIFEKSNLLAETPTTNSWITPLTAHLKDGVLRGDKKIVVKTRARATRCTLINGTLYHSSLSSPYQKKPSTTSSKHTRAFAVPISTNNLCAIES